MTATFNQTLKNVLGSSGTKTAWCTAFEAAFGGALRIRMFHDSANNAVDASATGTEFFNGAVTGSFTVASGNIVGLGSISSTTVRQSANLLTGTSMLVMEGNGSRATFSLGLTKAKQSMLGISTGNLKDFDYALFEQPTDTGGMGFIAGTGIKAPVYLSSGIGPAAPELDADAPVAYQFFMYPNDNTEANRVAMGKKLINVRDPDLTFDRLWIAKQHGDVRQMRSAAGDGTVIGTGGDCFRFAPRLLVSDKSNNATNPNKPVYRIRFIGRPEGRWASFPYRPDFNLATDTLSPQAFKIELYRADNTVVGYIEHIPSRVNGVPGTGKPVNYHGQWNDAQFSFSTSGLPCEPWYTCQMSLSWQSDEYTQPTFMKHLHPGVPDFVTHPSQVKAYDAWPDQWPVITGNYLANGLHAMRVAPKWPRPYNSGADTTIMDPIFENIARDEWRTQAVGRGYTPGSTGQHTWFMSPGGHRHDRAMWSHYTILYVNNPNGVRVHGAVPFREIFLDWNLNYHNEGCHYATDPELNKTLDKDDIIYGNVAYNDTYYNGGNEDFRPANKSVRLLTSGNQVHNSVIRDKNGRNMTHEYQRDDQHNISNAAQMMYFGNDPMGVFEARDSFNSSMLCAFGMSHGLAKNDFLTRQHAWFFKHFPEMWCIANNDVNAMSSSEIEFIAGRHLSSVVSAVEASIANPTTAKDKGLRDLGVYCEQYFATDGSTGSSLGPYDTKCFYFASSLMFAKQCGFLDRMRSLSSTYSKGIDIIVTQLCKASVDYFLDSDGQSDNSYNSFVQFKTDQEPAKFSYSMQAKDSNLQDWIHNRLGVIGTWNYDENVSKTDYPEGYNTQHFRAQFLWVLKNFLTEYNYPRTDAAIAKVQGWYDQVEAQKNAGGNNWHYLAAMMAMPKSPDYVGAPVA